MSHSSLKLLIEILKNCFIIIFYIHKINAKINIYSINCIKNDLRNFLKFQKMHKNLSFINKAPESSLEGNTNNICTLANLPVIILYKTAHHPAIQQAARRSLLIAMSS